MLLHALSFALVATSPVPIADPAPLSPPAQEIHQLLPQGTFAYFELASLDSLDRAVRDTVGAIDASELEDFDVMKLLSEELDLPGDLSGVLRDQPLGVAVAFPGDVPQPVPVFLIPFSDPTAYAAAYPQTEGMAAPLVSGAYVALTMGPDLGGPGAGAALTDRMAPGLLRGRVDLARLIEAYRPMIDMGMDMGRMQVERELDNPDADMPVDLEAMLDVYFEAAESILESAEMLEMTLQVQGTEVFWHEVFTAKAGSSLGSVQGRGKTPLSAVSTSLVPDAPIAMIGTADWASLTKQVMPFLSEMMSVYPDDFAESYMSMLSAYEPIYPLLGDAFSATGDFGAEGLRFAYVYVGGEPQKAVDAMSEAMSNPGLANMGVEISSDRTLREIGGGPVYEHELRYDWEKMMGLIGSDPELQEATSVLSTLFGDTMRFALAPRDDQLMFVLGGDDAYLTSVMSTAQRHAGSPKTFARSLKSLGSANPAFAMNLDIGSLLSRSLPEIAAAFGEDLPEGIEPVSMPIEVYFGIEGGRVWRGGVGLDVLDLANLIEAMEALDD